MSDALTGAEATSILESLYEKGSTIAVKKLTKAEARSLGAPKHLADGFFVVLTPQTGEPMVSEVYKTETYSDRLGVYRVHVARESDLNDEVISDSIMLMMQKVSDQEESRITKEKIGEYSLSKARKALLRK
jgi:hypothetical protein